MQFDPMETDRRRKRNWLITGCSSGFGRALLDEVIRAGDHVVATARRSADINDYATPQIDSVRVADLDVRDDEQARQAVRLAVSAFGGLDVVVNSAGFGLVGAFECATNEEIHLQFSTNVYGTMNVTRAAIPHLRSSSSGTIVNFSSVVGQVGKAGFSIYAASKFAVEGFSECLAHELRQFNINVVIVEPSAFRTDWAGRSLRRSKSQFEYDDVIGPVVARLDGYHGKQPGDPVRAARLIIRAVQSDRPPLRLPLGRDAFFRIREKLQSQLSDLDDRRRAAFEADFPIESPGRVPSGARTVRS